MLDTMFAVCRWTLKPSGYTYTLPGVLTVDSSPLRAVNVLGLPLRLQSLGELLGIGNE